MALRLNASAIFFGTVVQSIWPHSLWAQTQSPEPENDRLLEEVVVTGSRVIRSALDSPSPVTVYDAQVLLANGITTMDDFARYLPQNTDNFSDSMATTSPFRGSAAFNLRGIGLDGTLTLVNGRRVAPFGASADSSPFVDINAIPVAAIERIEVLKDGASAIYGSEAVAGVVNIITKQQVDGFTVEGGYLGNSEGDGSEWDIAFTGGWSNKSTRVTGTLSYFSRDIIWSRDRDFAGDVDFSGRGGYNQRSSGSSPPTATGLDEDFNFLYRLPDPACGTNPDIANADIAVPGEFGTCRFNYAYFTTMQNPSDRLGLTASMSHDFGDKLQFFGEVLYSNNQTESILAPTPLFNYDTTANHPDNPFGDFLSLRLRALDAGDRFLDTDVTTWRALAGLRGQWAGWQWEAAIVRSESEAKVQRFNAILQEEFQEALLGRGGPGGDQFYNPFGVDPQNSQEVLDQFVVSNAEESQGSTETTLDFQISGNAGSLPGGPIGMAFGAQARQQEVTQSADEILLNGKLASGASFDPVNADRDIWSVFAEFVLPLHETFEVQAALRYDDYSDFGSTTNPKIGLGWRPVQEVLVRATWGTSFRPPTIRNLYDPYIEQFTTVFEDPHRCGISNDPQDCFGRDVLGTFQGNPNLQPDEGETQLLGIAWEPTFADGLTVQLDLWQIEHEDRVLDTSTYPLEDFLLEQLDPFTNPFTERAPQSAEDIELGIPGPIQSLRDTWVNGGRVDTNGVDFDLNHVLDTNGGGTLTTNISYSYLNEYEFGSDLLGISVNEDLSGGYGFNSALPKHRANFRVGWLRGAHGVSALLAWADDFESFRNLVVDQRETDTPFVVDSYAQLDLQYSYTFSRLNNGQLRVGCRNCSNEDPPVHNASNLVEPFHEGRGLLWYLRWSQPFGR
ncbi:MAG: TonB-dependent receptor [Halioglobus sp.]